MSVIDIENSIKTKLESEINDLSVESFPENFLDYLDKFSHPTGTALIIYGGSSFSGPECFGSIVQTEKIDFSIVVLIRAFNSAEVHPYIDSIKQALTGYKLPGCNKIYPTKIGFLDEMDGIFIYQLDFTTSTKSVEKVPESIDPILKKISNYNTNGTVTEVISNA